MTGEKAQGNEVYQFHAFISYKRGGADEAWAKWLQKKLEAFRIPAKLGDAAPKPPFPKRFQVFRDKTDLGSHANLAAGLTACLEQSRFLLLVSSPRSAESPYVDDEVRYFRKLGRADRIIPFIIEGTPAPALEGEKQCYPPALTAEALGVTLAEGSREEALIKVVARLLGVDFSRLYQRHLRAQRKFMARVMAAALSVLVLVSFLAVWALNAERRATEQRIEAEGLVRFLTFDLRDEAFNYIPLKARKKITRKVEDYYRRWGGSAGLPAAPGAPPEAPSGSFSDFTSGRPGMTMAMHLSNQAAISLEEGHGQKAYAEAASSLAMLRSALEKTPDDPLLQYCLVESNVIMFEVAASSFKNYGDLPRYLDSIDTALSLQERFPDDPKIKKLLLRCLSASSALVFAGGMADNAVALGERAVKLNREQAAAFSADEDFTALLSASLGQLCRQKILAQKDGLPDCLEAVELARKWVGRDPHNFRAQQSLLGARDTQLFALLRSALLEEAGQSFNSLEKQHTALLERDPDNLLWQLRFAEVRLLEAERVYRAREHSAYPRAGEFIIQAENLLERGRSAFGTNMELLYLDVQLNDIRYHRDAMLADERSLEQLKRQAAEAREKCRKALASTRLDDTQKSMAQLALLNTLSGTAFKLVNRQLYTEALDFYAETVALTEEMLRQPLTAGDLKLSGGLVTNYGYYASAAVAAGRLRLAENCLRQGKALLLAGLRKNPEYPALYEGGEVLFDSEAASAYAQGDLARAVKSQLEAVKLSGTAVASPTAGLVQRQALLRARERLAAYLDASGNYTAAADIYPAILAEAESANAKPAAARDEAEPLVYGLQLVYYAMHLNSLGQPAEAAKYLDKAEEVLAGPPAYKYFRAGWRTTRLAALSLRARMLLDAGQAGSAQPLLLSCRNFDAMSADENGEIAANFGPLENWYTLAAQAALQLKRPDEFKQALETGRFVLRRAAAKSLSYQAALNEAEFYCLEAQWALAAKDYRAAGLAVEQCFAALDAYLGRLAAALELAPGELAKRVNAPEWLYCQARYHKLAATIEAASGNQRGALAHVEAARKAAEYLYALEPRQQYWKKLHAGLGKR